MTATAGRRKNVQRPTSRAGGALVCRRQSCGAALLTDAQQQGELVTLGAGQRGCAGGQLGDVGVQVVITAVVHGVLSGTAVLPGH